MPKNAAAALLTLVSRFKPTTSARQSENSSTLEKRKRFARGLDKTEDSAAGDALINNVYVYGELCLNAASPKAPEKSAVSPEGVISLMLLFTASLSALLFILPENIILACEPALQTVTLSPSASIWSSLPNSHVVTSSFTLTRDSEPSIIKFTFMGARSDAVWAYNGERQKNAAKAKKIKILVILFFKYLLLFIINIF